jgi:hypothetical protein
MDDGVEEATPVIYLTLNHCYITSDHHQKGSNTVHTIYPTLDNPRRLGLSYRAYYVRLRVTQLAFAAL